jgi:hypothetical protein
MYGLNVKESGRAVASGSVVPLHFALSNKEGDAASAAVVICDIGSRKEETRPDQTMDWGKVNRISYLCL